MTTAHDFTAHNFTAHDFSKQNLRGRSFKGQDLSGANFSGAQLQGANFTGAQLVGASLVGAKAGSNRWTLMGVIFFLIIVGLNIGFSGVMAGATVTPDQIGREGWIEAIVIFPIVFVFLMSLFGHGPAMALLTTSLLVFVGWVGFLIPESLFHGSVFETIWGEQPSISAEVGSVGIQTWAGLIINVFLCGTLLAGLRCKGAVQRQWSYSEALLAGVVLLGSLPGLIDFGSVLSKAVVIATSGAIFAASVYVMRQSLAEQSRFLLLRQVALALATWGGTRFNCADLSGANFAEAQLNCADFQGARLSRTQFYQARGLDLARADQALLRDRSVRHLLVTHRGQSQSYQRADLRDAYLAYADLNRANLTGANLSGADLTGARLEEANLSQVIALGTCFTLSHLTGTCLAGWHIDMSTDLSGVDCQYVYLLSGAAEPQERRPNNGEFGPGEFAKLFQEALNTVDLIFRNGLDFSAFLAAFKQVQTDHNGHDLAIRSIENKGDGMVLVKVEVPESADRAQLHQELSEGYAVALRALESRYRAELTAKDEQIEIYRRHQQDLKELTQLLSPALSAASARSRFDQTRENHNSLGKRVVLKLGATRQQSLQEGANGVANGVANEMPATLPVTLQIGLEGALPYAEITGRLPSYEKIRASYDRWQQTYQEITHCVGNDPRIKAPLVQLTNVSYQEIFDPCMQAARSLQGEINQWLNSEIFRPVKEQLLEQLQPTDSIRFFLQTDDLLLRQLPFHLWDWFDRYPKAELIVSEPTYRQMPTVSQGPGEVRILSILGDRTGIDIESDQALLESLPDVHLRLLSEPNQQQVTDQLWEVPWDILFFAGHSEAPNGENTPGQIRLNAHESLSLGDLKYGLRKATARGLKLAIFNTCDGMGLLQNLHDLPVPPVIVMRYPVPDRVAQIFLKNFLLAFSEGLPLQQAVREAREKLQGIESQFPCATWLPVVCQNPASPPLTWEDLYLD